MPVLADRPVPSPVTSRRVGAMSLPVSQLSAALADGFRLVDVRSQSDRDTAGVLAGALALDPAVVLDRLVPDSGAALRSVGPDTRWLLVGTDGHDAEWLTWHLHARGVTGARFLLGGLPALRSGGVGPVPTTPAQRRDLAAIAAH